jgi:lambda family phage portal protein
MYAAAKTSRMTGNWAPVDSDPNTVIRNSSLQVRARVRQLVRDMPYFARAVDVVTDYTVGDGIRFQSRVTGKDGSLDKKTIQAIEEEFSDWMDEADVAGKLHFFEMMQLAKRQDLECGEFIIIKTESRKRGRRFPLALQMLEADWLTSINTQLGSTTFRIDQGIEYDPSTGEVLAYHFADPWGFGRPRRIPAESVIHGFKMNRPEQLRGISPFTPGVLMARDLDDLMTAELDGARSAAKYLAMVKTIDPIGRQLGVGAKTDATTGQKIEELDNAIIEYLRPGEDIVFAKNERPSANFGPFVRLVLTMFAISTGAPYELLSGDYQGLNFSTARVNRNDFANFLRPVASRHIRQFCQRTFQPFMDAAVGSGRLELPGYFTNPAPYLKCCWQPPGMEPVDPLREVKSNIEEMGVLLRSPQEIAQARGRDYEEILKEIVAAKALQKEMGLEPAEVSTALANNPAALDDDKAVKEKT